MSDSTVVREALEDGLEPPQEGERFLEEPTFDGLGPEPLRSPGVIAWLAIVVGGFIVALVGIGLSDIDDVDGIGLLGVMSPAYYAGLAVVIVSFVVATVRGRKRSGVLAIGFLIVLLHGLPGLLEPHPRFTVAWLHVGFADQIADDGTLLPFVDARFSWPGFFAGGGFLQRLSGTESLLWVVRFAPVVINVIGAVLVWNLALVLRSSPRQAMFASGLFVTANWIGQDYFAPQALGFLMSTFIVTVVLRHFSAPANGHRLQRALLASPLDPPSNDGGPRRHLVYGGLVATILVLVVTHQLSPVFLGSTLVVLALFGRIRTPMLGVIVFAAMAAWLSFGAEAYWLGHLDKLFGSAGQPDEVLGAGLSNRATGSSDDRQVVLFARLAFSGAVWALTAGILIARRWRRELDPAMVALLIGPFFAVVAQPYGGELLLRVAYFTMPVCAIVIAQTVVTSSRLRGRIVVSVVMIALIPLFMLARFGNEAYEYTASDDLAITEDLYELAPDDSVVFVQNRQTLVSLDRIAEVRFRSFDRGTTPDDAVRQLRGVAAGRSGGVYVLLTESQDVFGQETQGRPAGWVLDFADGMLDDPAVTVESRRGNAVLLLVAPGEADS